MVSKLALVVLVALVAHEAYACIGLGGGCGCGGGLPQPCLPQIPMKQISLCVPDIQFCPPQLSLPSCGCGGRKKREAVFKIRARRLAKAAAAGQA